MCLGVEAAKVEAAGVADMCSIPERSEVVFASLKGGDLTGTRAGEEKELQGAGRTLGSFLGGVLRR